MSVGIVRQKSKREGKEEILKRKRGGGKKEGKISSVPIAAHILS